MLKSQRKRYVVRIHIDLHQYLIKRASLFGMKPGTFISCLVENELHLVSSNISSYELSPHLEMFLPTQNKHRKSASPQISVFITDEGVTSFSQLKSLSGYEKNGEVVTGLLLNTEEGKTFLRGQNIF